MTESNKKIIFLFLWTEMSSWTDFDSDLSVDITTLNTNFITNVPTSRLRRLAQAKVFNYFPFKVVTAQYLWDKRWIGPDERVWSNGNGGVWIKHHQMLIPDTDNGEPVMARYIRFQKTDSQPLNLAEVIVYDTYNTKLSYTPSQSSTLSGYPATNLNDWNNNTFAHTNDSQPWMELDLGSDKPVAKIEIVNRQDCCQTRFGNTRITVKNQAGTQLWTELVVAGINSYIYYMKPSTRKPTKWAPVGDLFIPTPGNTYNPDFNKIPVLLVRNAEPYSMRVPKDKWRWISDSWKCSYPDQVGWFALEGGNISGLNGNYIAMASVFSRYNKGTNPQDERGGDKLLNAANDKYLIQETTITNDGDPRIRIGDENSGCGANHVFYYTTAFFNVQINSSNSGWWNGHRKFFDVVPDVCCEFSEECGNLSFLAKDLPRCTNYAKEVCVASNPTRFTSNFCQSTYCKTTPSATATHLINCDTEFSTFCNVKTTSTAGGTSVTTWPNYDAYPDLCACFMNSDFLRPLCDQMAYKLGIDKNPIAQNKTGLDVCNQACKVVPFCKLGGKVPVDGGFQRAGRVVIDGYTGKLSDCGTTNMCFQTVNIDNQGTIGDITINQSASCFTKQCIEGDTVVYTLCDTLDPKSTSTRKIFTKKIQDEKEQKCGSVRDPAFTCAEFDPSPSQWTDKCENGKRVITLKQTFSPPTSATAVTAKDAINAFKTLVALDNSKKSILELKAGSTTQYKYNTSFDYNPSTKVVSSISDCGDCVVDLESIGQCYLDGNKWVIDKKKTKIVSQPFNNPNTSCSMDATARKFDCTDNKDCKLSATNIDKGCIDGTREINYRITEQPSGTGKSCETQAITALGASLASKNPSITVSADKSTLTASFSCEDCKMSYELDPPTTACVYNTALKKYTINRFPRIVKEASGAGTCPAETLRLVQENKPRVGDCEDNQDCVFNTSAVSDVCDDKDGIRTLIYSVSKPVLRQGKTCEEVGEKLGTKFSADETTFNTTTNRLTIKASCDKAQGCKLGIPTISCDEENKLTLYSYPITQNPTGRGQTCDELVVEMFPDALDLSKVGSNLNFSVEDYTKCEEIKKKEAADAASKSKQTTTPSGKVTPSDKGTPTTPSSGPNMTYVLAGIGFLVLVAVVLKLKK